MLAGLRRLKNVKCRPAFKRVILGTLMRVNKNVMRLI